MEHLSANPPSPSSSVGEEITEEEFISNYWNKYSVLGEEFI
jgi:hypothetical protein